MLLTNEKDVLKQLSPLTLIMNHRFAKHISETIEELEDQEHMRRACVGMFNELITLFAKHPDLIADHTLLINFIGIALEGDMNIVKMQEIADTREREIFNEIKLRCAGDLNAPTQAD